MTAELKPVCPTGTPKKARVPVVPGVGEVKGMNFFGSSQANKTNKYRIVRIKLQSHLNSSECSLNVIEIPEICHSIEFEVVKGSVVQELLDMRKRIADVNKCGCTTATAGRFLSNLLTLNETWSRCG